MDKKHSKALVERYPEFFEYLKDHKGPIIPIQFGFECGNGWFVLLDELMSEIQNHIKNENSNRDSRLKWKLGTWCQRMNIRYGYKYKLFGKLMRWAFMNMPRGVPHMEPINITQIKEKFGGLRFYYYGGDNAIDGMVNLAESMSYRICEYCGTTEDVGQTQGWIVSCCRSCHQSEERLKNMVWKPGAGNVTKEVTEFIDKVLEEDKNKKDERKGSKRKVS